MPLPMASTPRLDDPAGGSPAVPSWAAEVTEAGPAPLPVASASGQLPLFTAGDLAPAAPRARLPRRIKALLDKRGAAPTPAPDTTSPPGSSWPDSFFDADAGRDA